MPTPIIDQVERDGFRRVSGEDEEMFSPPRPYEDQVSKAANTPKSTSPPSPAKCSPEKEVLRPISMPAPFKI